MDRTLVRTSAAVLVGAMAVVFNTTTVSVALPTLVDKLHTTLSVVQWVSTVYLLALFITIPVAGWAQNRIGGKRLWIAALAGFLVTSVLCGLAWNIESLIAFRALQGLAGGFILPLLTTLIIQAAGGRNLGRVMATVTLPVALGPVIGPVIGGIIVTALDWQWIFYVNVPFAVAGLIMAAKLIPSTAPGRPKRLDAVGLLLVSPAAVSLIYGLTNVTKQNGFARFDVWFFVTAGTVLLAAFVVWALQRRDRALIDLRLLRYRGAGSTTVLQFLTGVAVYGALLLLPLYFEGARGATALQVGLLLIPQGVGSILSRFVSGRLTDSLGPRPVAMLGFAIVAVTTVPFAVADASTSEVFLLAALLVRGFGQGMVNIPISSAAYIGLDKQQIPDVSIIGRTSQQLGGSFGVAVLAVILQGSINGDDSRILTGLQTSFWWAAGFTAVAVILALILPGRAAATVPPAPAQQPAGAEAEAKADVLQQTPSPANR